MLRVGGGKAQGYCEGKQRLVTAKSHFPCSSRTLGMRSVCRAIHSWPNSQEGLPWDGLDKKARMEDTHREHLATVACFSGALPSRQSQESHFFTCLLIRGICGKGKQRKRSCSRDWRALLEEEEEENKNLHRGGRLWCARSREQVWRIPQDTQSGQAWLAHTKAFAGADPLSYTGAAPVVALWSLQRL